MKYVVIPVNQYKDAEALLASEDYDGAIAAFEALGDYKDAAEQKAYAKAEDLLAEGDSVHAALSFGKIGYCKDARACSMELWERIAERATVAASAFHSVGLRSDGTLEKTVLLKQAALSSVN